MAQILWKIEYIYLQIGLKLINNSSTVVLINSFLDISPLHSIHGVISVIDVF